MERTLIIQNPHWSGNQYDGLVERTIMSNLREKSQLPHIQILTGVRRSGKSTLFKLLINDLLKSGVSPKSILTITLDAPIFISYWNKCDNIQNIIDVAEKLTGEKVEYLFIDEIQQVKDWEIFVKNAYDIQYFKKIYITGSNSNLLANRFSSMLAGRYFANEVSPFSLKEIFATFGVNSILDCYRNKNLLLRVVDNCLQYGSFPEIVLKEMDENIKIELLQSYFTSIVQQDCIIYNAIRNPYLFYKCVNYLFQNVGNRFSLMQLGKSMLSNENTMTSYVNYLCNSYICYDIRNFSYSLKETKRSDHKCYCIDNGLIQANTQRYSSDIGRLFENLVFNELRYKGFENIAFDNGKGECDFLAWKGGELCAFQVCFELSDYNRDREFAGFNVNNALITQKTFITYNQKEEVGDIRVVPLWEWVMEEL